MHRFIGPTSLDEWIESPSKRPCFRCLAGLAYPLRQFFVHQDQADGVLRSFEQLIELVEFPEHLHDSCEMNQCSSWVASFHAAHGVGGRANAFSQILLRQVSATARKRDRLSKPI